MNITVGGLLITSGIVVIVITVLGTLLVAFATGMSDAPQEKIGCFWPSVSGAVGVWLILLGTFSGL